MAGSGVWTVTVPKYAPIIDCQPGLLLPGPNPGTAASATVGAVRALAD